MEAQCPIKKNEVYEIEIDSLGADGEGIGRIDGFTLFVPDGVPGDYLEVKVLKVKKRFGYGKILRIIKPSESRIEPLCKIASQCGGCQFQNLNYEAQLEFKRDKVEQALKRIGGVSSVEVLSTIGMEDPYFYRNKGQFPVGFANDEIKIGFYAARSHRIVPLDVCAIQSRSHTAILSAVRKYMSENQITAYDEENHRGLIRHVVTRESRANGGINVTLVINGDDLPAKDALIGLLKDVQGVEGICININKERTNVILGSVTKTLYGDPYIIDTIGGIEFKISPASFYQVNPVQTEKLYQTALDYAELKGDEIVWDAYCGIGTITLFLAKKAKKVYGVEIVPQAIADANDNKERNGITNVEFFVGKAEDVITEKYKEGIKADVMVVDPPRKGCDVSLLNTMIQMAPKRIVYVSCDPATLARDVKILVEGGYEVNKVQPVDMFPMTGHVECVVLMTRL